MFHLAPSALFTTTTTVSAGQSTIVAHPPHLPNLANFKPLAGALAKLKKYKSTLGLGQKKGLGPGKKTMSESVKRGKAVLVSHFHKKGHKRHDKSKAESDSNSNDIVDAAIDGGGSLARSASVVSNASNMPKPLGMGLSMGVDMGMGAGMADMAPLRPPLLAITNMPDSLILEIRRQYVAGHGPFEIESILQNQFLELIELVVNHFDQQRILAFRSHTLVQEPIHSIASRLRVSESTVTRWIDDYRQQAENILRAARGSGGSGGSGNRDSRVGGGVGGGGSGAPGTLGEGGIGGTGRDTGMSGLMVGALMHRFRYSRAAVCHHLHNLGLVDVTLSGDLAAGMLFISPEVLTASDILHPMYGVRIGLLAYFRAQHVRAEVQSGASTPFNTANNPGAGQWH